MKIATAGLALALAVAALAAPARAEGRVDERRPASADGVVDIDVPAGSLKVIGWAREEVQVTGTLGDGAEDLDFGGASRRTRISVETWGNPHRVRSELEIHVPAGSRLNVDSFSASITIEGVTGEVQAETVQGAISVAGSPSEARVSSVNGSVSVTGASRATKAESVSGSVKVTGASGEIQASSVSGSVQIEGRDFGSVQLESVSGGVDFDGSLQKSARLSAESVSGRVTLVLPAATGADVKLSTFSGSISTDFDAPEPRKTSRWTPEKDLEFTIGGGGARVSVDTMSGGIAIRKK
jgi:DUF4097 and DUF4098 domain-containing protein YvlB